MKPRCECGCGNETRLFLQDGDLKYIICHNCMVAFINLNLSKEQFFSLLKNKHTVEEFYLHSDFYDEDSGEALQPK